MAVDAYLQIDGIKGEATDSQHKDWIECLDVHFGRPATQSRGFDRWRSYIGPS
jgi:type VI protein secretion system component Hcp